MKINNYAKGVILTFLGAICWGISGVLGEYLLNVSKIDSLWVISNRLFYSGLFMILFLYFKQNKEVFNVFKAKKDIFKLVNFAFLGLVICQATYFLAIKYTNAGTATVLQYLGPTMIMVYYCIIKRKLPKLNEFLAIVFSLLGIILISTHLKFDSLIISKEGLFWGLFSALGLTIYNVLSIDLIKKFGSMLTVGWGLFLSGIVVQIATKSFYIPNNFNLVDLICMLGVVIIGTIVSFTLYLQGVTLIGAVRGSIIACVEPIAAIIFSMLLIGTHFSFYDILGSAIILFAVLLLNRR
ncbi:DMT family transporter [Gemelliphila palaticanis]|uniref:EamA family transporter n=1 Tax=Gemelliphila palaticanis TaxID=81950 RepID=A0ABX2T1W8_9BACL|nr:DMT family transporter [Gemella palaticanis]MBF0715076.1 EamA family transporter [Gemella palaticanis]NYS47006.1 EamA family transporter [Gemella palaticanis]